MGEKLITWRRRDNVVLQIEILERRSTFLICHRDRQKTTLEMLDVEAVYK
jgi:hypothetical protein